MKFPAIFPIFLAAAVFLPAQDSVRIEFTVDFGKHDGGKNFGTLFEVLHESGNAVFGAGFPGVWNTQSRINRRTLTIFTTRPEGDWREIKIERLPRPSPDAGVYLFDHNGELFAKTRSGKTDNVLRRWDASAKSWVEEKAVPALSMPVGDAIFSLQNGRILRDETEIETQSPPGSRLSEMYFSSNHLFFRRADKTQDPPVNELVAQVWARSSIGIPLTLQSDREFIYAWGQLGDKTLGATNTGGVYDFDGERWRMLVEPDSKTSFQIYTAINFYDRLLLGHYPTGELWEYDGESVQRKTGWPPVLPGVSKSAREAQTSAIYGGQMIVGVWPWAELWRYDRVADEWKFMRRMFQRPPLTDAVTHPWEAEVQAANPDGVRNSWGHRITSLVPLGGSLFLSTSAKSAAAFDSDTFPFLTPEVREEYGAVYQITLPGQLSVQTKWKPEPVRFVFEISNERLTVKQDGEILGQAEIGEIPRGARVEWGRGVFGATPAKISKILEEGFTSR
ncbi:MAG: hypothetical protein HKN23_07895 [Verrucomicrobiales bacterium]|nr:hypothetical protein [Verrucomicrobiales bacterium]